MNNKIAKIEYVDSNLINEQTYIIAEPATMTAVGFVIKEDDEYITLAMELTDSDEYRGQLSIPKASIRDITFYDE